MGKQAYKLKLPRKWRVYDIFHVLLLEQNPIKKGRVDENATELDASNKGGGEYKIKAIWNNAVNMKESTGHLPGLYYLVSWKRYSKEENT